MVFKRKTVGLAAIVLAAGVVGVVATSQSVRASPPATTCKRVSGHYVANVTTTNCTSPTGLCYVGTVTNGGIFDSASTWIELDQAPSAGMPGTTPSAVTSYTGTLTFDARNGDTLTVRNVGIATPNIIGAGSPCVPFGPCDFSFTEAELNVTGTGKFANASGVFFISGALPNNTSTFDGELSGSLCGI